MAFIARDSFGSIVYIATKFESNLTAESAEIKAIVWASKVANLCAAGTSAGRVM